MMVFDKSEDGETVEIKYVMDVNYPPIREAKEQIALQTQPMEGNILSGPENKKNWNLFRRYTVLDEIFINKEVDYVVYKNIKISVAFGDFTEEDTDVVVVPTIGYLTHDSLPEAIVNRIHEKGGENVIQAVKSILEDRENYPIWPTECEVSPPGKLNCKWILYNITSVYIDVRSLWLIFRGKAEKCTD